MSLGVDWQVGEQRVNKVSDLVAYKQGSKFRSSLSVRRGAAEATAIQVAWTLRRMVEAHLLPYMALPIPMAGPAYFLESIFIDQATLNGTRPVTPEDAEPAMTPSG